MMRSIQALSWLGTPKLYIGGTHHDDVGGQELGQRAAAEVEVLLQGLIVLHVGALAGQIGTGEVADRLGAEVAVDHLDAGVLGLEGLDDAGGDLPADGILAQDGRIDVQELHGILVVTDRNRTFYDRAPDPSQGGTSLGPDHIG